LSSEVDDLVLQLDELNLKESLINESLGQAVKNRCATERRISTQEAAQSEKAFAECSQRSFVSVKGITRIAPTSVCSSNLDLIHIGGYRSSCLILSFYFSEGPRIQCKSSVDVPHLSQQVKSEKLSRHAMAFLKSRCSVLSKVVSDKVLQTGEEMRRLVRQLDWTLGRVESTSRELNILQKRFGLSVEMDPNHDASVFLVRVPFVDSLHNNLLVASFELNASYPFGPLNVSLEPGHSDMDLAYLQKHLMKNAKPGFGYLSRACDVIAAVVQSAMTLAQGHKETL
jgi:hypothetical protein